MVMAYDDYQPEDVDPETRDALDAHEAQDAAFEAGAYPEGDRPAPELLVTFPMEWPPTARISQ